MCGRYSLTITKAALMERYPGVEGEPAQIPRYNIAPSQSVPVVFGGLERPCWATATWGFPSKEGGRLINARAETVGERWTFRRCLDRYRCLVPADGFYEWTNASLPGLGRRPFRIVRRDGRVFSMAGLWRPASEEDGLPEFVILTTRPNDLLSAIHDRMPVILSEELEAAWIDLHVPWQRLANAILRPIDASGWEIYEVSKAVNRPDHDGPDCVIPLRRLA